MAPPLVDEKSIRYASLHNPLPFYLHVYIAPFVVIWSVFFRYYLSEALYERYFGEQWVTFVISGTIVTAQSLAWLSTNWNVNILSLFTTIKATYVKEATLIKVLPVENSGAAEICHIHQEVCCDGSEKVDRMLI